MKSNRQYQMRWDWHGISWGQRLHEIPCRSHQVGYWYVDFIIIDTCFYTPDCAEKYRELGVGMIPSLPSSSGLNLEHVSLWHANIARTYVHVEITHFPMRCIIRACEAQGHRPGAFQVLMMHQVEKCAISVWAWVHSCFYPMTCKKHRVSHAEIMHFRPPLSCMNIVLVMGWNICFNFSWCNIRRIFQQATIILSYSKFLNSSCMWLINLSETPYFIYIEKSCFYMFWWRYYPSAC